MGSKIKPSALKKQVLNTIIKSADKELMRDFIKSAAELILQDLIEDEIDQYLGRGHYKRLDSESERVYRNGYADRRIRTSEGYIRIKRPRLRNDKQTFKSEILSRLEVLESKLFELSVDSYKRGLSTRDIEDTFKDKDGSSLISRSKASELSKTLTEQYEQFSKRDLSDLDPVYLFVDGVYESIRKYTNNQAILCAWAICSDGSKEMLGLMCVASESAESYKLFFNDLLERGLRQPLLVVSDGASSLINAVNHSFPHARRQRCIAHKLRNIRAKLPRNEEVEKVFKDIKKVYYTDNIEQAERAASTVIENYVDKYPGAIKCFSDDLKACLTHLIFPEGHRTFIRTTNLIERTFQEEKRRTKIIAEHQNEKGCIGLVSAVLLDVAKKWNKVKMTQLELTILRNIKKGLMPNDLDFSKISYNLVA